MTAGSGSIYMGQSQLSPHDPQSTCPLDAVSKWAVEILDRAKKLTHAPKHRHGFTRSLAEPRYLRHRQVCAQQLLAVVIQRQDPLAALFSSRSHQCEIGLSQILRRMNGEIPGRRRGLLDHLCVGKSEDESRRSAKIFPIFRVDKTDHL